MCRQLFKLAQKYTPNPTKWKWRLQNKALSTEFALCRWCKYPLTPERHRFLQNGWWIVTDTQFWDETEHESWLSFWYLITLQSFSFEKCLYVFSDFLRFYIYSQIMLISKQVVTWFILAKWNIFLFVQWSKLFPEFYLNHDLKQQSISNIFGIYCNKSEIKIQEINQYSLMMYSTK